MLVCGKEKNSLHQQQMALLGIKRNITEKIPTCPQGGATQQQLSHLNSQDEYLYFIFE